MVALTSCGFLPSLLVTASGSESINFWQALVMGFVQGLTEFLPISSSAHLRVIPAILGWPDFGASFTAVIQLGSLVAVLIYFREDLRRVLTGTVAALQKQEFESEEFKIFLGVTIGTLPILFAGAVIKKLFGEPTRNLIVIALTSIGLALLLGLAERYGRRNRTLKDIRVLDGILVGIGQAVALIPGVSRSGSTITTALFLGLERQVAARFSFLLGIPALFLAGVVEAVTEVKGFSSLPPLLVGTVSAFVFSYLSIDWLLKFLQRSSTLVFIIYRILFGLFLLTCIQFGWLSPL
ncbi:undecaprenyl-diphosphate phosphatase [Leptolyngbya sp. FACHB-261]|uniref:undecaprenyl-diphosphate phosphatase n=1 Tax=Leptolyngbya sp. FACHB-261 TaxID=2692806 RepID=UPI00168419D0|nr:undecaprenyl-diphosphate phosphatase [Leptolyngbya sp. FACHB-261]MBD2099915.1 undecaprenyl-diphosphate phosphatase [Leptolyngbya sp. FACHB-261]